MAKIKVGVIGTGFIGPAHIEALRRLPDVEVVALADRSEAIAVAKADELGIPKGYGDYRELVADREIQAVHVCTPNNLHHEMAKAAMLAGKHVLCEKPLALTVAEARDLVSIAEERGIVNAINFNARYYPLMRQARTMARKGEIGRVFGVHGSFLQDWLFFDTDYSWRIEPEFTGKSRAVADIGSHWMDLVEHVTGLRIVEVLADLSIVHERRKKPLKPVETYAGKTLGNDDFESVAISTEDYANVLFRFDSGARGSLVVSQVSAGRKNRIYFEVDGSKESIEWNSEEPNRMWIGRRDGCNQVMMKDPSLMYPDARAIASLPGGHQEGYPDTVKHLFGEFYARISGSGRIAEPTFPVFKDGLREIELCDGIVESSQTGLWVRV